MIWPLPTSDLMSSYFLSSSLCSRHNGLLTPRGAHQACSCFHLNLRFSPPQILSLQISPWLLPWPPSNLVSERVSSFPQLKLQPLLTEPSTPNPFHPPLALYTLHVYMWILFCNTLYIIHLFITYSMCLLLLLLEYTLHTSRDPRHFCSLIYPCA